MISEAATTFPFTEVPKPEPYSMTDWQKEDIAYLDKRMHSANWSEMGCYKTSTFLWLMEQKVKKLNQIPLVLIVTNKSGKGTYFDAIPKCLDPDEWLVLNFSATDVKERYLNFELPFDKKRYIREVPYKPTIVLAHYHCFLSGNRVIRYLRAPKYSMIVLDEAHRIKHPDTTWTVNLKQFKAHFKHVMTGTGFINNPAEIWSLFNFLYPNFFTSRNAFKEEYCETANVGGYTKIIGIKEDKVDQFRAVRKQMGVMRKMNEVHKDIKEPIFHTVDVELSPEQRRMFEEIKFDLYTLDQQGLPIYSPNVLSMLNRLRQISVATPQKVGEHFDFTLQKRVQEIRLVEPSSKLDAVMDIIEGLRWDNESKQQVVVFSNFNDPLQLLETRFKNAGISYLRLLQAHTDDERYKLWHDIFPAKDHQVFLTGIQLGGESINLSSAQYCIFLDRSWSPKDNKQAVGRVYRPGQVNVPEVIHINAIDSTDQRVERTNLTKEGWFAQIFGSDTPEIVEPEPALTLLPMFDGHTRRH